VPTLSNCCIKTVVHTFYQGCTVIRVHLFHTNFLTKITSFFSTGCLLFCYIILHVTPHIFDRHHACGVSGPVKNLYYSFPKTGRNHFWFGPPSSLKSQWWSFFPIFLCFYKGWKDVVITVANVYITMITVHPKLTNNFSVIIRFDSLFWSCLQCQ